MFWKGFGHQFCIDLGTSNTLIFHRDKEVLLNEPTVVAVRKESGRIEAAGKEAKAMIGRTPGGLQVVFPLHDGVIANYDLATAMLQQFFRKIMGDRWFISSRVAVSVPCGITSVQKRAIEEVIHHAGAKKVVLIESPLATAVGAGLPVNDPVGSMILDIGGGKTEAAIVSLGGIVCSNTMRMGSSYIDRMIIDHLKNRYNLAIGALTAEELKKAADSFSKKSNNIEVRGRDLVSGLPKAIEIDTMEINDFVDDFVQSIIQLIRQTIEKCPPEMAGDVIERGIILCGGGALLNGLEKRLRQETQVPVHLAEQPMESAVLGLAKIMDSFGNLKKRSETVRETDAEVKQAEKEQYAPS